MMKLYQYDTYAQRTVENGVELDIDTLNRLGVQGFRVVAVIVQGHWRHYLLEQEYYESVGDGQE